MQSGMHVFNNLDVVSRNIFGAKQASLERDACLGRAAFDIRKRSKSLASRSSIRTVTASTTSGSLKLSYKSLSTVATSVNSKSTEESTASTGHERGRLPKGHFITGSKALLQIARSKSCEFGIKDMNGHNDYAHYMGIGYESDDESDIDLKLRLELASKNGIGQHSREEDDLTNASLFKKPEYEGTGVSTTPCVNIDLIYVIR